MAQHKAKIEWKCTTPDFRLGKYTREHSWTFDGGVTVPASAAPAVVPAPWSNPANVDPEEAFVAAISSCHMLTFLHVARLGGFQVESYEDEAVGDMAKNERGVAWVAVVTLNPKIVYAGDKRPTHEQEAELHHKAHDGCFISQSIKTEVKVTGFE
ncbi:MAG TPA: OsmC family protein [Polyangia bacterium]|jgi:organic hydroperoxide reductase OsmC/OhrA|nr:OsmC family protein [Polyangia bacterium]